MKQKEKREEEKLALKEKIEINKAEAEVKKAEHAAIMKEREETKKKLIEDKILVKEASVERIKLLKTKEIEERKSFYLQKRMEKTLTILENEE